MCPELVRSANRPPLLHSELVALAAPTQVWSAQDGSVGGSGAHGLFHGDWRYVRAIELLVDGAPVEAIATADEADWTVFRAVARVAGARHPLARVMIERMRELHPGGMVERVTLVNGRDEPVDALVELVCDIELAPMPSVQAGIPAPAAITLEREGDEVLASDGTRTLRVSSRGGEVRIDGSRVIVAQQAHVAPEDWSGMTLELEIADPTLTVHGTACGAPCEPLRPTGRPALDRWATRAVADLENLLLDAGHGAFPAAGAPWHMTMVARDALIACRLLLPMGTDLAEGTLRTLAARQGVQFDAATGEEPGRILHEMRQGATDPLRPGVEPPPVYSGSVDPTPLWIVLLHDAWRAGMPLETVRELRTALHAALYWMQAHSGDGFLACADESGMGLSGKGWKDDPDGMRLPERDAAAAAPAHPVATAQAQGLACRAAVGAAELLDALGDDGERWRTWAERLRARFRDAFWVEHDGDRFPAMAIDADGTPVETLVSDIGQLIGTTLLSRVEEAEVARLLLDARLSSGFGLRTMATDAPRYWPLAHYCGAVWPHDTAIAIEGLMRADFPAEAQRLAEQLERAADAFDGRMPEVYAGYGVEDVPAPIPYPGACSPQAWSAASVVPVHAALTASGTRRPKSQRHLVALTPASPPSAPEPVQINAGAGQPPTQVRLRLVSPGSAPSP